LAFESLISPLSLELSSFSSDSLTKQFFFSPIQFLSEKILHFYGISITPSAQKTDLSSTHLAVFVVKEEILLGKNEWKWK